MPETQRMLNFGPDVPVVVSVASEITDPKSAETQLRALLHKSNVTATEISGLLARISDSLDTDNRYRSLGSAISDAHRLILRINKPR